MNFNNLNIENSTGNITVLSNVTSDLNIENSTGDIILNNCDVLGNASIKTKTGNISIKNVNCKKLDIKSSTGDTNLDKVIVENDFNMKGTTGDLFLDSFDAKNMYINLSTGDVVGTILSNKFFVAKSETGNVNVPETREGEASGSDSEGKHGLLFSASTCKELRNHHFNLKPEKVGQLENRCIFLKPSES